MDVLSLIRQAHLTQTAVNYADGHYIFNSHKFPETTKTCFKRTLDKGVAYFYTLRDVMFFLENSELPVGEYRREVVKLKIQAVVEADKQALKGYVTGQIETCPQLDLAVAAASAAQVADSSAAAAAAASGPQISAEALQEQRQQYAALMDKSLKAPAQTASGASIEGVSADKMEELRMMRRAQKRTSVSVEEGIEGIDPDFLRLDRQDMEKLRSDEVPAATRQTVLCKPGTDFSFAIKLFNDHILKVEVERAKTAAKENDKSSGAKAGASHGSSSASASASASAAAASKKPRLGAGPAAPPAAAMASRPPPPAAAVDRREPIIIVPSALSGLISSINAADFLQHGKYISIEEKRNSGGQREKEKKITRALPNGKEFHYLVVDNLKSDSRDWDRVVAVFALGQPWQFKDWPEKYSKPVELFNRVLGVHLTMDDRAVDANVLSWNCKVLKINQSKRHLDTGAVNEFWAHLDDFMKLRKPALYNGLLQGPHSSGHGHSHGHGHGHGHGSRPPADPRARPPSGSSSHTSSRGPSSSGSAVK